MFEFNVEIINRGGFKFVAERKGDKWIYETDDKDEIKVLKELKFVKSVK